MAEHTVPGGHHEPHPPHPPHPPHGGGDDGGSDAQAQGDDAGARASEALRQLHGESHRSPKATIGSSAVKVTHSALMGHDTISLGSGADTITEAGSATLAGSAAHASTLSSLGSGGATVLGSSSGAHFVLSGATQVGGDLKSGVGAESASGVSGSSFASAAGGAAHPATAFLKPETVAVHAYDSSHGGAHAGSGAVIDLGGGAKITLVGFQSNPSGHTH
jgi:hypothetical protein